MPLRSRNCQKPQCANDFFWFLSKQEQKTCFYSFVFRLLSISKGWSDFSDAQRLVSAVWGVDPAQPLPPSSARKVFWWNPHLFSFKELVRARRCGFFLSCESFSFPTLWFLLTRLFLSKVELHSNDTRTSSHGRPFFFCHRKHHGGVRRILRSAANVRSSYVIAQFPKVGGMSEKSPLYTNKYTQTQILFRNLSKSVLASTSPPPDGMVVAQVSHRLP